MMCNLNQILQTKGFDHTTAIIAENNFQKLNYPAFAVWLKFKKLDKMTCAKNNYTRGI